MAELYFLPAKQLPEVHGAKGAHNGEEEIRACRREEKIPERSDESQACRRAGATELSQAEQDLLSHMRAELATGDNSLGGNPVLRDPKSGDAVRPPSANRGTVEALQKRGLIVQSKSYDPLAIAWRMKKEK